jgi:hypothetical protein
MSSRKKILLLVIGTAVLLSGVLFLASIDRTTAQETFIPIELPWDTPPPHRLYYIAEPAAVERKSLLSPERMAQVLGTTFVSAGEIEGRVSSVSEIDGVIIHHSAISTVDPEWLGGLYQSCQFADESGSSAIYVKLLRIKETTMASYVLITTCHPGANTPTGNQFTFTG